MELPEKPFMSPRALAEADRLYRAKRFEDYMVKVDKGELTRELAITALREELEYNDVQIKETA